MSIEGKLYRHIADVIFIFLAFLQELKQLLFARDQETVLQVHDKHKVF
jgi:hypothetical protein